MHIAHAHSHRSGTALAHTHVRAPYTTQPSWILCYSPEQKRTRNNDWWKFALRMWTRDKLCPAVAAGAVRWLADPLIPNRIWGFWERKSARELMKNISVQSFSAVFVFFMPVGMDLWILQKNCRLFVETTFFQYALENIWIHCKIDLNQFKFDDSTNRLSYNTCINFYPNVKRT